MLWYMDHLRMCDVPQVMCEGSYSSSLCSGSYVDSWCCAHSIWDHPHRVPLYICQRVPRDVHFYISLCAIQEGKDFLCISLSHVIQHQLFTTSNAFFQFFHQIQEEYYRLFKNVPCCYECLRWTLSNEPFERSTILQLTCIGET